MHMFTQMLHEYIGKNHHTRTYIHILCIYIYIHTNVHGYTLAFGEAQGAAQTRVCLPQLAPLCWSQQGPSGERGGRSAPDPGPARLRPRDTEVSGRFVLVSLGSTPSGHAVSIARTPLTNSLHSASLLGLHNLLVTKLNHT